MENGNTGKIFEQVPAKQAMPPKERRTGAPRDTAFALICAVLCVLLVNSLLWGGTGLGAGVCLAVLFSAAAVYMGKPKKLGFYSVFCMAAVAVLCVGCVFADGGFGGTLVFLAAILMFDLYFIEAFDCRRFTAGTVFGVADWAMYCFYLTFGKIVDGAYALFCKRSGADGKTTRKIPAILAGIGASIPVLLIVIPLLISSDAAFEGLVRKIPDINVGEILVSLIFGLSAAHLVFSRQFVLGGEKPEKCKKDFSGFIEPAGIVAALSVISAVYVLYLVSQLAYFFNAFSGLLEEGYTMASYARRGFFEMSAVCALNLLIVFCGMFLCKKRQGKIPVPVRILSLFLCLFSVVTDVTAMSKMVMYIKSYGMTKLRMQTFVFMIFLTVVFAAVIFRIFSDKVPYMKISVISAAVLVALTAYVGTDRMIANYNADAYLSGKLSSVDIDVIDRLGSGSTVPALVRLAECDNADVAERAKKVLNEKYHNYFGTLNCDEEGNFNWTFDTGFKNPRGYKYYEYKGLELLRDKKDLFFTENYCG